MSAHLFKPADQGKAAYDGGKIQLQKPIGFSEDGGKIKRLGPLFYWAWGKASGESGLGMHPHQGFEILSYVIQGEAFHQDTLGNESVVGEGGAQMMHTGSGMYHAEGSKGPMEMFQIWLEPDLREAVKREPKYVAISKSEFTANHNQGVSRKEVMGPTSPIPTATDVFMTEVRIQSGHDYMFSVAANRTLAVLAFRGEGTWVGKDEVRFSHKDFIVVQAEKSEEITIRPGNQELRMFFIEVPTQVDYPLYRKH
jgi:redox-sensitive bicupin YhaK (pirin superfamily)